MLCFEHFNSCGDVIDVNAIAIINQSNFPNIFCKALIKKYEISLKYFIRIEYIHKMLTN